jgi:hypothetical protein
MGVYRQFSNVQNLGDKAYFPLRISKLTRQGSGGRDVVRVFEKYVFLTSYDENYEAAWNTTDQPYGRVNVTYDYAQTKRKASIAFKLPARNVAEAKSNLDFCAGLSNLVYGDYYRREDDFVYDGANSNNRVKFGNLIRNELCYFDGFTFSANLDAGVFEYDGRSVSTPGGNVRNGFFQDNEFEQGRLSETSYVNHNQKGKVYPKEINVQLDLIIVHDYLIGFGGEQRGIQYPLRWAQNTGRDWPHGTGPIGVMRYMQATTEVSNFTEEEIEEIQSLREEFRPFILGPDNRPRREE